MSRFLARSDVVSWGRVLRGDHRVARPAFRDELDSLVAEARNDESGFLPVGLGRSYGDSGLNVGGSLLSLAGLDKLIAFDPGTGLLQAEAGATLEQILAFAIPRGFFLPVTPGTKFVTLGGAIANDVHGKNHHTAGTIGRWIEEIGLLRSDLSRHRLTPSDASGLFAATIGGLGLTGIITDATLRLKKIGSSDLDVETIAFGNLSEFFALAEESERSHEYTVSWIDCLASGQGIGRGLYTRANHAPSGPRQVSSRQGPAVPLDAPGFALNRYSIASMNLAYYWLGRSRAGRTTASYDGYFYPLDGIRNWNRLYGRRGMYQYQSVVPPASAGDATAEMLRQIAEAGQGSFLVVLKTFGALQSPGLLSFPMEGTTLALDFPNRGASTLALLDRLDDIVREAKGRLYPAKDGRLPKDLFVQGFPKLEQFRAHLDPLISSSFWRRMENT